jgi:predicted glycogen debranching enzyme
MTETPTPRPSLPLFETAFGPAVLADFERSSALEWLETDGTGGYSSSSVSGAHTRRYHGLLVAATEPPVGRKVLISRLDETLRVPGSTAVELGCNRFPGTIHPRGHERLVHFHRCLVPQWTFEAAGVRLRKSIVMLDGEPTTVVLYEVLDAAGPFTLSLRPFLAGREDHALVKAAAGPRAEATFEGGSLRLRFPDALPEVFVAAPGARFEPGPDWWRDFEYVREQERGFDFREDLWTPGEVHVQLTPGARLAVTVSTRDPAGQYGGARFQAEEARRAARLAALGPMPALRRALTFAAGQFLARRGHDSSGTPLWTVMAGFPWFADWGRDTMIALPGLCLATRRHDEARGILRAFARVVHQGLLPNRFLDAGADEAPEYNTVDAGLWYFVAVWRYLQATNDERLVLDELLPVLRDMLSWHRRGTLHGIREDTDGLLLAGEGDDQLTWMDARVDGRPITPRHGKAVEIQALWINAHAILARLEARSGNRAAALELRLAERRARRRFGERFWNPERGFLNDVVDGDSQDASLRPNQILALALPFPVLDRIRGRSVLAAVERALLTPRGLRTLAPDEPPYRGRYEGGPAERDAAYHQGTVWPWLLGPYLTALARLRGEAGRRRAVEILGAFAPHLGEAGLGTVSEIFDGDAPHAPRGCIAQAWSVAELLRAAIEDAGMAAPPSSP